MRLLKRIAVQIFGRTTPSIEALASRLTDVDCRIRWGGGFVDDAFNGNCTFLNGPAQLKRFEAASLPCVQYTGNIAVARQWLAAGHIVLGRRPQHTQGRDIVTNGHKHFAYRDYWVKYEPAESEWRFHIFKGKSIGRGQKIFIDRHGNATYNPLGAIAPIIRSRRRGWHMEHESTPPKGLRELAKQAVKAVGYDFGAVDMLVLPDGSFRLLEVNSRPALRDDYTLSAYASAIRKAVCTNLMDTL